MRTLAFLFATALVTTACNDEGRSGENIGSTKLGELSTAETKDVCASVHAKMQQLEKAFVSVTCTDTALLDDDTCSEERAACIKDPPEDALLGDIAIDCESGNELSVTEECPKVTVEQLENCLEETVKSVEDVAKALTCTTDESSLDDLEEIKACTDLEAICPELADLGTV
jgi:hypothetical protein